MIVGTTALGKEWLITKAYREGDNLAIEGWISTPMRDMEKDILEPEAFSGDALAGYFQRGAPISTEHNTSGYPVGYMLRSTLVRQGQVIQEEKNPKHLEADPEYRYFDPLGIGWYGKGIIYDETASKNVTKGAVGAFSWIGMPRLWDDLPDGGRRFKTKGAINPLLEATITAYPINQAAIMRIAKSHGYDAVPKKTYKIDKRAVVEAFIEMRPEIVEEAVKRAFAERQKRNA
jgi:hypothetical protein